VDRYQVNHSDPGAIRLAILDTDSGFVQVLVNRLEGIGWQYRRLEAAPRMEEFVAMRVNAVVVDLAIMGPSAWEFLERLSAAMPGLGVVVCTGRSTVAQRVRGLRMGADDWVTKPCHPEEVLARVEAVIRRRKQATSRIDEGPMAAGELQIRADQFQAFAGGRSADLTRREFEGLHDGPRRPLRRRLHPQGQAEARARLARLAVHPHPLRSGVPLRPGVPS
jgi:DNA-binding response OmpR family regulator